jgi:hypothetical protein
MAFWGKQDLKEPLRQNRWYLRYNVDGLDAYTFALKECKKPEYEIGVTEHRLLTHTVRYPTLLKWLPIDIKMISVRGTDDVSSLNGAIESFISDIGYSNPVTNEHQQISKQSLTLDIYQVDENGNKIEEWNLYNPLITKVNYGTLSYENEGLMEVSLSITYDFANHTILIPK